MENSLECHDPPPLRKKMISFDFELSLGQVLVIKQDKRSL